MPRARVTRSLSEIRCGFPFVVLHAGNLGFYGAWDTLLKAAEILRNEDTGSRVYRRRGEPRLARALRPSSTTERSVSAVSARRAGAARDDGGRFARDHGAARPRRRGRAEQALFDPRRRTSRAGRCAAKESDAARIVVESGCGVAADPDDPSAVAQAIRELRGDPARLARWGAGPREVANRYARVNELERFVGIMEDAAVENKNGGRHLES